MIINMGVEYEITNKVPQMIAEKANRSFHSSAIELSIALMSDENRFMILPVLQKKKKRSH